MASWPRCFRCCMLRSSGPVDLLVLLLLIAVETSSVVSVNSGFMGRLRMWRSVTLFVGDVQCGVACVN